VRILRRSWPKEMSSRHLRLAAKIALRSTHAQHQMSALLLRGGAVVAAEANSSGGNGWTGRGHAEARVLRPHVDTKGCHLIVLRLNGKKTSRPCSFCTTKIQAAKLDRVSFVDTDGQWKTLRPEEL
jgi:tRNA(Arg) A34 adenosine deaminase TadA